MKKIIAILCVFTMLFCLCSCFRLPSDEETTAEETTEKIIISYEGEDTYDGSDEDLPTVEQSEWVTDGKSEEDTKKTVDPTKEISTEAPTSAGATDALPNPEGGTVVEKTSKGYDVVLKDNIWYVGGIMIANKSYELPSSYNPGDLTDECDAAFYKMACAASAEGLTLYVLSGFRSYETQDGLYTRYCNADGQAAADTYSARPGHSEHQTGMAIDVNSVSHTFADTAEGIWLAKHCAEYGFILRYPEGKDDLTGYTYEPWHIRYIGSAELAQKITDSGLCLEEYLGIDSVYAQ